MTKHRFIVESTAIDRDAAKVRISNAKQIRQIARVLRLGPGSPIEIVDEAGNIFDCRIDELARGLVVCCIHAESRAAAEASTMSPERSGLAFAKLRVLFPIIQNSRFDLALQKMTEVGVDEIVPFWSSRTNFRPDESSKDNASRDLSRSRRWAAIVREASEQCERRFTPSVVAPKPFGMAVSDLVNASSKVFILHPRCRDPHLLACLLPLGNAGGDASFDSSDISIIIGPEGGFADEEVELACTSLGATRCSLGSSILRSETAAIVAVSCVRSIGEILRVDRGYASDTQSGQC